MSKGITITGSKLYDIGDTPIETDDIQKFADEFSLGLTTFRVSNSTSGRDTFAINVAVVGDKPFAINAFFANLDEWMKNKTGIDQ